VPVTPAITAAAALLRGARLWQRGSGVRAATAAEFANRDAFVLTDGGGRQPLPDPRRDRCGDVAQPLTAAEARAILEEAFTVMSRARAQIRQPLDSRAQVTISAGRHARAVLGIVRSPDAPIFGIDVSLQKARTANFFSGPFAAAELLATAGARCRNSCPHRAPSLAIRR
jgi:uncharacterized protein GlcG (DUF336 family)